MGEQVPSETVCTVQFYYPGSCLLEWAEGGGGCYKTMGSMGTRDRRNEDGAITPGQSAVSANVSAAILSLPLPVLWAIKGLCFNV
jgi:hypothetical protein